MPVGSLQRVAEQKIDAPIATPTADLLSLPLQCLRHDPLLRFRACQSVSDAKSRCHGVSERLPPEAQPPALALHRRPAGQRLGPGLPDPKYLTGHCYRQNGVERSRCVVSDGDSCRPSVTRSRQDSTRISRLIISRPDHQSRLFMARQSIGTLFQFPPQLVVDSQHRHKKSRVQGTRLKFMAVRDRTTRCRNPWSVLPVR